MKKAIWAVWLVSISILSFFNAGFKTSDFDKNFKTSDANDFQYKNLWDIKENTPLYLEPPSYGLHQDGDLFAKKHHSHYSHKSHSSHRSHYSSR